jgi:hypothetical protein
MKERVGARWIERIIKVTFFEISAERIRELIAGCRLVVGWTGRIFVHLFEGVEKRIDRKSSIRSSKKNEWETNILSEKRTGVRYLSRGIKRETIPRRKREKKVIRNT